jgi:hypothetical protein
VLVGTLSVSQDLVRMRRNKRSPFYLYGHLGTGLTHLRNSALQDAFLLRGDDMLHVQMGLSPTYFFSRDFALQLTTVYQKQMLVNYQLDALWSIQLSAFFLIPHFKPF